MTKKLYLILGVNEEADHLSIRKAYRKLALKYHPDKNLNNPAATEKFKELVSAYEILSNTTQRKDYDKGLIDDNGVKIQQHPNFQPQYRSTSQNRSAQYAHDQHAHSNPSTKKTDPLNSTKKIPQPQPSYGASFFVTPRPVFYYFFNSPEDASKFQPHRSCRKPSVFIYITPSPLNVLLSKIEKELNHHSCKVQYTPRRNQQPPHVFVQSYFASRMEQIIDRLIYAQMIMMMEIDKKAEPHHQRFSM